MHRILPALSALLTGPKPKSDFADLSARAVHGPRACNAAPGGRAELRNLRAAVSR